MLFFTNVENVNFSIKSSLLFCVNSLIPSIFIFMIICSFFLYSSVFSDIFALLPKRLFSILGICKKYASHIFLCSFCGFINGPKVICEDYRKNGGNEREFSNAIILSSNAGIGFLVGFLGARLWGSSSYGVYLFFTQLFSSVILGRLLLKHDKEDETASPNESIKLSFSSAFSRAVTSSALTMLSICAFVVFFSSLSSILLNLMQIPENSTVGNILSIVLEFSKGSLSSVAFKNVDMCAFFSGFCIGFGGLCVHFQTFAICDTLPLNKRLFFTFKLLHGILCGICSLIYVRIFHLEPSRDAFSYTEPAILTKISTTLLVLFTIVITVRFIIKFFSKKCIDFSQE